LYDVVETAASGFRLFEASFGFGDGVKQRAYMRSFQRIINVLRQSAGESQGADVTQAHCHDPDDVPRRIHQWAAGIAGLYWNADLKIARIVLHASEAADFATSQFRRCAL